MHSGMCQGMSWHHLHKRLCGWEGVTLSFLSLFLEEKRRISQRERERAPPCALGLEKK